MVQIYHVSKRFKHNCQALEDITLEVEKGDFIFITGPSGAGKTTLLKLLFVEERPTSGQIIVLGRNLNRVRESNLHRLRRQVGVVFQDFRLLKDRTVFKNIDFVLRLYGHPPKVREKKAWQILSMVGLEKKIDSYPLELSGGEQQRIAIARAIVNDPPLILADEPTGNLDQKREEEIMAIFNQINARGATLIIATHNRSMISRMGKKVVSLDNGRLVSGAVM
ncbi:cell division ATP-binding protein FtsE [bacterium]|nr:cell division ATP-binding protein FtsE [bacterium]